MKLHIHSDIWRRIYFNIIDTCPNMPKNEIERVLANHCIRIHKTFEGRWEEVEINLNDEELTLFLLKYA